MLTADLLGLKRTILFLMRKSKSNSLAGWVKYKVQSYLGRK